MSKKLWPTLFGNSKVIKYIWKSDFLEPKPFPNIKIIGIISVLFIAVTLGAFIFNYSVDEIEQSLARIESLRSPNLENSTLETNNHLNNSENTPTFSVVKNEQNSTKDHSVKTIPQEAFDLKENTQIKNLFTNKIIKEHGWTYDEILKTWKFHNGVDFKLSENAQITSVSDGIVEDVLNQKSLGLTVKIKNGDYNIYYSSLKTAAFKKGDLIKKGTVIGTAGFSENLEDPHLHFAIQSISTNKYIDLKEFYQ